MITTSARAQAAGRSLQLADKNRELEKVTIYKFTGGTRWGKGVGMTVVGMTHYSIV